MNSFLFYLLLIYIINQCHGENTTYTNKYDGTDLDEILANERLLTGYINCLLDIGPCTPDGKELKGILPDAINDNCRKCTERQREGADKVLQYMINKRIEEFQRLEKKYDPHGTYKMKYLQNKEEAKKSSSKEKASDSEYDDDADDENDDNKDNYTKKDTAN